MIVKEGKIHFYSDKKFFKKGQLTIFIIVALLIVSGVVIFFLFRNNIVKESIPLTIQPVYTTFDSCIQDLGKKGIYLLESQGGYIYLPEYQKGSYNFPSSSYLNFMGNNIPFWDYFSSTSLEKKQIPSQGDMEDQLKKFIESNVKNCDFSINYAQGFEITLKDFSVSPKILDNKIIIDSSFNMNISLNNQSFLINHYKTDLVSNLGLLYNDALKVYNQEEETLLLENYTIDVLRLYAPVDGFEISCSPKVWDANKIYYDLKNALEPNIQSITSENKNPKSENDKYFYRDFKTKGSVKFLTFMDWPMFLEVNPSQGDLLIANPVGNTPELSILGFCFIPYHFVYSLNYPVLVQISKNDETFQFPLVVYVDKNKPKFALTKNTSSSSIDVCSNKVTPVTLNVYDNSNNPIPFSVNFECINENCYIGNSSTGNSTFLFPECVNGVVKINSNNFLESRTVLDNTLQESEINIYLTKTYPLNIQMSLDNRPSNEEALISFDFNDYSKTLFYPKEKTINLSEGIYNISVKVYKNSSLTIPETETEICVPIKSGIKGLFGISENSCSKIKIPNQLMSNVPIGGGIIKDYEISETQLRNSKIIQLNVQSLKTPTDFLSVQKNVLLIDENEIGVNLI
ncbi:hypothetical protein GYA25_00235 [Candidatus Woesearchaeota archaeon]|jgi:hypothetical protein|nr:hypothetical protein [Candidatus Woesearchaeota archaeon]